MVSHALQYPICYRRPETHTHTQGRPLVCSGETARIYTGKAHNAKIAAKNAAKAGVVKKSKGTPSKENIMVKAEKGKKSTALKGQATKKDGSSEKSLPSKKATMAKPEKDFVLATIKTIEVQVAADMLDSQQANIIVATVQEQQLKQQVELQFQ